jgi:hypothetical protein
MLGREHILREEKELMNANKLHTIVKTLLYSLDGSSGRLFNTGLRMLNKSVEKCEEELIKLQQLPDDAVYNYTEESTNSDGSVGVRQVTLTKQGEIESLSTVLNVVKEYLNNRERPSIFVGRNNDETLDLFYGDTIPLPPHVPLSRRPVQPAPTPTPRPRVPRGENSSRPMRFVPPISRARRQHASRHTRIVPRVQLATSTSRGGKKRKTMRKKSRKYTK